MPDPTQRTGSLERWKDKTGAPRRWPSGRVRYRRKVRWPDGSRPRKSVPEKHCKDESSARAYLLHLQEQVDKQGSKLLEEPIAAGKGETVSAWFDRYYAWRANSGKRNESVADSQRNFRNWIAPKLGTLPIAGVTREHLEAFSTFLDEQVNEEEIAWKTAGNIWGEILVGFGFAKDGSNKNGKNLDLRVLATNPEDGAAGPSDGTKKQKPFLRPAEITKLLACDGDDGVPLDPRQTYGVAIYTAMGQAGLRAMRVGDVDLDAMQSNVTRQPCDGVEKQRAKNGRSRTIAIEPNLVPLHRAVCRTWTPLERGWCVRSAKFPPSPRCPTTRETLLRFRSP